MFRRVCISIGLLTFLASGLAPAKADIVTGAPPGGPVTIHNGSFDIDLDADSDADLAIADTSIPGDGFPPSGSLTDAREALHTGIYLYQPESGGYAAALNLGDQIGSGKGGFIYNTGGLAAAATIHVGTPNSSTGAGDPQWIDGAHHFLGVDLESGTDHNYGWVELSLSDSGIPTSAQPWYDVTVYDWAYDTQANQTITIPEPPAFALAVLGSGVALSCGRRASASGRPIVI